MYSENTELPGFEFEAITLLLPSTFHRETCGDDGPQFKGIFIKNLYYLYQSDHKQTYKDFILKNADAIWSHNRDGWNQLGLHWNGPFGRPTASSQSAAQDVLNAALN